MVCPAAALRWADTSSRFHAFLLLGFYQMSSKSGQRSEIVGGCLARIIHENAGRNGSLLLRSEVVMTFGPSAKERADGRVYCTTDAELPSIFPDHRCL